MGRAQGRLSHGIVLLDSEGLNKFIDNDPRVVGLIRVAQSKDTLVAVSNLTLIETWHSKVRMDGFRWHVSRLEVSSHRGNHVAGHRSAMRISTVTMRHRLRGGSDSARPRRTNEVFVTSDVDDINKHCGDRLRAVGV